MRASRERHRERGAMMVEFVLILPLFCALLFGTIDFAAAYSDAATVRQGDRDAARDLVVGNVGSNSTCTLTGVSPSPNDNTRLALCRVKRAVGLSEVDTRVKLALPSGTYLAKQPLLVCVAYPHRSMSGFFSSVIRGSVHAQVEMRIESVTASGGAIQAVAETPLGGDSWSWCG